MPKKVKSKGLEELQNAAIGHKATGKLDFDGMPPLYNFITSQAEATKAFHAIEAAVYRSVGQDIQREPFSEIARKGMTRDEMKRRIRMCMEWIRRARGDHLFSLEKTLDLMPHALRKSLDGQDFNPEDLQTRLWTPT